MAAMLCSPYHDSAPTRRSLAFDMPPRAFDAAPNCTPSLDCSPIATPRHQCESQPGPSPPSLCCHLSKVHRFCPVDRLIDRHPSTQTLPYPPTPVTSLTLSQTQTQNTTLQTLFQKCRPGTHHRRITAAHRPPLGPKPLPENKESVKRSRNALEKPGRKALPHRNPHSRHSDPSGDVRRASLSHKKISIRDPSCKSRRRFATHLCLYPFLFCPGAYAHVAHHHGRPQESRACILPLPHFWPVAPITRTPSRGDGVKQREPVCPPLPGLKETLFEGPTHRGRRSAATF